MNPPELGDDDAAMIDGTSTEAGASMPNGNGEVYGDVLKDTIGIGDGGVS
jgi:hypothetical protein